MGFRRVRISAMFTFQALKEFWGIYWLTGHFWSGVSLSEAMLLFPVFLISRCFYASTLT